MSLLSILLLIAAGIALLILNSRGTLKTPPWVGIGLIGIGLFFMVFRGVDLGMGDRAKFEDKAGNEVNACGCLEGQLVEVRRNRKRRTATLKNCAAALDLINRKKKWGIYSCRDMIV